MSVSQTMRTLSARILLGVAALTVMFAVSVALEYALDPPLEAVSTLVPAVPVVWSQARNVTSSVTLPLKLALAWK